LRQADYLFRGLAHPARHLSPSLRDANIKFSFLNGCRRAELAYRSTGCRTICPAPHGLRLLDAQTLGAPDGPAVRHRGEHCLRRLRHHRRRRLPGYPRDRHAGAGEADKVISLSRCTNLQLSGIHLRRGGHFAALITGLTAADPRQRRRLVDIDKTCTPASTSTATAPTPSPPSHPPSPAPSGSAGQRLPNRHHNPLITFTVNKRGCGGGNAVHRGPDIFRHAY